MFDIKHVYQDAATAALGGGLLGSKAFQIDEEKAARRDEKRARELERQIQDTKAARERRKAVREARAVKAELAVSSQASGTSSSSGSRAGQADIGAQLASNLSFLDTVVDANRNISLFQQKAADHRGNVSEAAAYSGIITDTASLFVGGG